MHSFCHLALFQLAVALNQNEQFSQKLLSFLKNCCQNKFKLIQVQFKILKMFLTSMMMTTSRCGLLIYLTKLLTQNKN